MSTAEPLDEATIQSLRQGLGDDSAKRREATIQKYLQIGLADERINSILRVLAQSDPQSYVREAAGNVLRQVATGQFGKTAPPASSPPRGTVSLWGTPVSTSAVLVILLLCVCAIGAAAVIMPGLEQRPAASVQELAMRQTASAIVRENNQTAAALTATAGGAALPTPSGKDNPVDRYGIGDVVAAGNWEYTVTRAEKTKTLVWSEYGNATEAKGTFLIVYLTLKNVGNKNFSIHAWDFTLRDGGGIAYDASSALEMYSFVRFKKLTQLGDQFPPGIPLDSALVFDINPASKGLALYLEQARQSVDLGQ